MKKIFRRNVYLFFVAVIASLVLSGCRGIPNIKVEQQGEENVFIKGAVMKKFPPVPIYPESQVIESYATGVNYGASAVIDEDLEKVIDYYQKSFNQLGWESSLIRQTENNYVFDFRSQEYRGSVTVNTAADNKKTAISVVVSPR